MSTSYCGGEYRLIKREGLAFAVLYDAETLYADEQIGRLHRAMKKSGLHENALWIITSDHGQGLGAHDWIGHAKQIYNAQLWVPLLFWFSDHEVAQTVEGRLVTHVDVLPTVAELTGGSIRPIIEPQGQSLLPYLRGEHLREPRRFSYSERSRYDNLSSRRTHYEPGSRYALQDLEYKYLLFTEGSDKFYDLRDDPYEMRDLIDSPEYVDRRDQKRDILVEMILTMASRREAQVASPEEIEKLRALGYIQ